MSYPKHIWDQIKGITAKELISALEKDGWLRDVDSRGAKLVYLKEESTTSRKRVVIHYHPRKTYQPKLLKALLEDIGWTESDLKRLKIVR